MLVVSAAAGCGGDDDDGAGDAEQRELLESVVLTEADLPESLIQLNNSFTDNEQASQGDPELMQQYETWGRQLGLSNSYVVGPDAPPPRDILAVRSDATLYEDERGCRLSYQFDVESSRQADWASSFPDLTDVEVEEMDASSLGDEGYWLRITGLSRSEPQTLMVIDQVVIRMDRMRAFIRAEFQFPPETPRDVAGGQVLGWAQLMSRRMEGVSAA